MDDKYTPYVYDNAFLVPQSWKDEWIEKIVQDLSPGGEHYEQGFTYIHSGDTLIMGYVCDMGDGEEHIELYDTRVRITGHLKISNPQTSQPQETVSDDSFKIA